MMKRFRIFFFTLFLPLTACADSLVWSFRSNFFLDKWNEPILPFLATIPQGSSVKPENIRALITEAELQALKGTAAQAESKRVVKRQIVSQLKTDADVIHARSYLLPESGSAAADVFLLATGYIDKLGLVALLQQVAKWQCAADEKCPEKTSQKLENLLAKGGKIMKTEAFFLISGKPWILATITYEVSVGTEVRVVPLRSRLLEVQIKK